MSICCVYLARIHSSLLFSFWNSSIKSSFSNQVKELFSFWNLAFPLPVDSGGVISQLTNLSPHKSRHRSQPARSANPSLDPVTGQEQNLLANSAKQMLRNHFVRKVLLFYLGPLAPRTSNPGAAGRKNLLEPKDMERGRETGSELCHPKSSVQLLLEPLPSLDSPFTSVNTFPLHVKIGMSWNLSLKIRKT